MKKNFKFIWLCSLCFLLCASVAWGFSEPGVEGRMGGFIREQNKILDSIILFIFIYVVYNFFGRKETTNMSFHNKSMFQYISHFCRERMLRIKSINITRANKSTAIPRVRSLTFQSFSMAKFRAISMVCNSGFLSVCEFSTNFTRNIFTIFNRTIRAFNRTKNLIRTSFLNKFFFTSRTNFFHVTIIALVMVICQANNSFSGTWDKTVPLDASAKADYPTAVTANNDAVDRLVSGYRRGMKVTKKDAATLTITAGECVVSNTAGTKRIFLNNTASTDITFSAIDTGSEANEVYYVYAIAALTTSESATFKISLNASLPHADFTYYLKIGSFANVDEDISEYEMKTIPYGNVQADSEGSPPITAIYSYVTSFSSYTEKTGELKVAYGSTNGAIAGGASQAITNLPFSSASSYQVAISSVTGALNAMPSIVINSGSQFTWTNNHNDAVGGNGNGSWIAIGY